MTREAPNRSEELSKACDRFKEIVSDTLTNFRRYPSAVSMGVNRLYANLGTGVMTIDCDAKDFLQLLESFYSFESITHEFSIARKGIVLKHPNHALEKRTLKIIFGDLDFIKMLDYNIRVNPDLKHLCDTVKTALKETAIIQKYENYALGKVKPPHEPSKTHAPKAHWRTVLPVPPGFQR